MNNKDLLKRLLLLKNNPKLAEMLPQAEILTYIMQLMSAFSTLEKAVSDGRLRGEDGRTPIAELNQALSVFNTRFDALVSRVEGKLATITNGTDGEDGKDAVITDELKQEIADLALGMIELPDFDTLIKTTFTINPQAIRDGLELLQDEERLDASAIKGLEKYIKTQIIDGGTIGKQQVYGFIRQAVADGLISSAGVDQFSELTDVDVTTTAPNTKAIAQYEPISGKWLTGVSITVSATEPTDPKTGDLWVRLP